MTSVRRTQPALPVDLRLAAVIALSALLLACWLQPSVAGPTDWPPADGEIAGDAPAGAANAPEPVRLSVLDVLGKVAVVVLLVYGVGFAVARYRGWQPQPRLRGLRRQMLEGGRLQLRETFALPRQEGTLYLLELEGQTLLVGATAQQVQVTWAPAAPDHTSSFEPLPEPAAQKPSGFAAIYQAAEEPRAPRGPLGQSRGESEWAQERSQLISALLRPE